MITLKGAEVSAKIKEQVQAELEGWRGPVPKLAIIRVGEKADDISYERGAIKKMESFGLQACSYVYPENISHEEFKKEFQKINQSLDVAGILLLCPLPRQVREKEIKEMIDPAKDLDGISPVNIAKVFAGDDSGFAPCTAEAVVEILKNNNVPIEGKRVAIVGRSMLVGKPLSMLMLKENATVTVCHTRTRNLEEVCQEAEILVAAAGRAKLLDQRFVAPGAVVVDVGIHVGSDGKLCGDVDFQDVEPVCSAITPVPGGVGPMTIAMLLSNCIESVRFQQPL